MSVSDFNDHTVTEVFDSFVYRSGLYIGFASNALLLLVMKNGVKIVDEKKILTERDPKQASRLDDENRLHTRQKLLQPVNEGPSQPASEKTLRIKRHAISICSRVFRNAVRQLFA